jgi:multidrug transporter EmrE-like cation transporter
MKWLILLIGIASNSAASVLIKFAVSPPRSFPSMSDPLQALMNWPFWLGLCLYGVAFLLYSAALMYLPLNVAHPILTAGAIAVVALLSVVIFHEKLSLMLVLGLIFVVIGVSLISSRA